MKIKLSKSQWQKIGQQTGWIKKAIFGPGFAEDLGSQTWKERFGKDTITNIIIDGTPLVMSTQLVDTDNGIVVVVEHNKEHIGVYDETLNGFVPTYTKHIEKYMPYKGAIDAEAKKIMEAYEYPKEENMREESKTKEKIYKLSGQMDIYKSVRKQMPPPEKIMDDGKRPGRKPKDFGGDMDMPTLDDLKREALVSCEIKGHEIGEWEDFSKGNRNISHAKCINCGKGVQVIDKPLANEIDVGGEAVLTGCSLDALQAKVNDVITKIAMEASIPVPPKELEEAIRLVSIWGTKGTISTEQFHTQSDLLKSQIERMPQGPEKDRLTKLFNMIFSYNKIENAEHSEKPFAGLGFPDPYKK